MDAKTLKDLSLAELQDLFLAEKEVLKAFPPLAKAAQTGELKETLLARVKEGKQQVLRIESVFKILHEKKPPSAESGLSEFLVRASEVFTTYPTGNLRDAAILAGIERVEAYKSAAYSSIRDFLKLLGEDEAVKLLEETLAVSGLASKRFAQIAIQVNAEAYVDGNSPDCFLKK